MAKTVKSRPRDSETANRYYENTGNDVKSHVLEWAYGIFICFKLMCLRALTATVNRGRRSAPAASKLGGRAAAKFKVNLTPTPRLARVGRAATVRDPCHDLKGWALMCYISRDDCEVGTMCFERYGLLCRF